MDSIKDMVKDGQKVHFQFYRENELWYKTDSGFEFPVPIRDTGTGIFLAEDKAILFMRYIRKHLEYLTKAKEDQQCTPVDKLPAEITQCAYYTGPGEYNAPGSDESK